MPSSSATLWYSGAIVHSNVEDIIYHEINAHELSKHMTNKYKWSESTYQSINWRAHHHALINIPK